MYFVFKLSFLLHHVTNQNFKKKPAKFLIINKAKIESKKNHRKKIWMTSFFRQYILGAHTGGGGIRGFAFACASFPFLLNKTFIPSLLFFLYM